MSKQQIPAIDLRLADVVLLENINAYHTATVKSLDVDAEDRRVIIELFRPYTATADFSCGDSVICYVGIEQWKFRARPGEMFTVLERKELK